MSTDPLLTHHSHEPQERNWLPVAIAASTVVVLVVIAFFAFPRSQTAPSVTPINTPLDPYAAHLQLSGLAMSQSTNYIGDTVTYLDGHIANTGDRTVTGITVQVLFRGFTNLVTQNNTQPLKFIRMTKPYIDVEPVADAPLKPGQGRNFRLVFDGLSSQWNHDMPEIRIVHVQTR